MLNVKFVNKSGERVMLYEGSGLLKILEPGKRWDKDPSEGVLDTVVVMDERMKFPPSGVRPKWIAQTEWTWNECPEHSIFAPFRTIVFLDGNQVKLKKRPKWKEPQMRWPVVTFLFLSHKMKLIKLHLDRGFSSEPTTFYNGLPHRMSVDPLSKYAPYKNWIFDEAPVQKDKNPFGGAMVEEFEMIERGEDKRSATELEKIAELKKKDEERRKAGQF